MARPLRRHHGSTLLAAIIGAALVLAGLLAQALAFAGALRKCSDMVTPQARGCTALRAKPSYDLAVIGGGDAGAAGSALGASLGASTVLIDAGTRTNQADAKALRAAAKLVADCRKARRLGFLRAEKGMVNYEAVQKHLARTSQRSSSHESLAAAGVEVVRGKARFADAHTLHVKLSTGRSRTITARRFLIAVGAGPPQPRALGGLAKTPHETLESLLKRPKLPASLVIIGAGATGCAIAQACARLGVDVTLLGPALLPREDEGMQRAVASALEADGVRTLFPSSALTIARVSDSIRTVVESPDGVVSLESDALLLAAGRTAATSDLGVEAAGVRIDKQGVIVDSRLRSVSAQHIYAAGRCVADGADSAWQGVQAVHNALRPPTQAAPAPRVVHTDPEVAVVGCVDEGELLRLPLQDGEFLDLRLAHGRLVGAMAVSARGGELVSALAMALRVGAGELTQALRPLVGYAAGPELLTALAELQLQDRVGEAVEFRKQAREGLAEAGGRGKRAYGQLMDVVKPALAKTGKTIRERSGDAAAGVAQLGRRLQQATQAPREKGEQN